MCKHGRARPGATIVGVYSLRPDVEATAIAAMCGKDVPCTPTIARMLDETGLRLRFDLHAA